MVEKTNGPMFAKNGLEEIKNKVVLKIHKYDVTKINNQTSSLIPLHFQIANGKWFNTGHIRKSTKIVKNHSVRF